MKAPSAGEEAHCDVTIWFSTQMKSEQSTQGSDLTSLSKIMEDGGGGGVGGGGGANRPLCFILYTPCLRFGFCEVTGLELLKCSSRRVFLIICRNSNILLLLEAD